MSEDVGNGVNLLDFLPIMRLNTPPIVRLNTPLNTQSMVSDGFAGSVSDLGSLRVSSQFTEFNRSRGGAMQAASRSYVLAAAALAVTGAVAIAPFTLRTSQLPTRTSAVHLVDTSSVLNVPINLFDDIVNIPNNEVQALDTTADSLLDTGNWWVPSSTNIWGWGPWDSTHVAAVLSLFLPFPSLDQGLGGLDYQLDGLLAAELPESPSCAVASCAPILPPDVITGTTSTDRTIAFLDALDGQTQSGLFDHMFRVPLSELLSGYTYTAANDAGVSDAGGPVYPEFGFPLDGGTNPFEGATTLVNGLNEYPWDGVTYTLNPLQPFENFYGSLLAAPSASGVDGTGIELPTLTEFTQALQNVVAGSVIDFDPFTAGSPVCAASCDVPESMTYPAIVQDIANLDSSNTTLQTWLAEYAAGTAAAPTQSQIDETTALLQVGAYNLTPDQLGTVDADLTSINPELPALYTNLGVLTDPGYLAFTDATANATGPTTTAVFDPVYGGTDWNLVGQDLLTLLTNNETNVNALSDPSVMLAFLDPAATVTDPGAFSAGAADPSSASAVANDAVNLSALLGLSGASGISADLSAMLSQLSTELSTALSAEFGTTLSTDLATTMPSDLLSLF
ncbi:hypothetical protein [Candidatus Mycobacterium methanotrophicum]|uniref:PE-PPE domain-containing protein n=1 Tax=Candidatus Mycobacterium methanotrophicum TaxID=2943498 RepID=A0ABY4QGP7_9MYCO|nr:hypothetical protein [Candidatus Mycobacterium methanotrophicum]UQX09662.1 hypothetical protein M5I08_15115 [Candidatus Mycobacterium methanotrophicum]